MDSIQSWFAFLGVVCGGLLALFALMGMAYRVTIRSRLMRIEATMDAVEFHLKVNGSEHLLPLEMQGLPTRALMIRHIISPGPGSAEAAAQTAITAAATAKAAADTAQAAAMVVAAAATAAAEVLAKG